MSTLSLLDPELAVPTRVDRATSQRLATAIQAQDGGCYCNALRALPRVADARYVEGVVVIQNGLRFEHAWLESAAGVVDPTPAYAAMPEQACTYFPGPRWTLGDVHALFSPEQDDIDTPLLQPDISDSPHRQAWITATLAAFRHVSALHLQQTGRPAIPAEHHASMLDALIGSYWADRVREGHGSHGQPTTAALQC